MKKQFEVLENETIADCLARMEKEGFRPVRRIEKPVFWEVKKNDRKEYEPATRKIVFEGRKSSSDPNIPDL
ncbi:NETI motif-containing protein [Heyndrickxia coagulans]|uniref:NETI motif-containing protein n=1 Tax=Heyndrickxia coagulans TaxID=1398 RepID=UPI001A94B810|nr:NETI motif-containing protein [Heyndrickxia coagulans]